MVRSQRDENTVVSGDVSTKGPALLFDASAVQANATENVTISNVAPAGVGTATISKWLPIDIGGTTYYIPLWT